MSNCPNEVWNIELIEKKGLRHVSRGGSSVEIHNSALFSKSVSVLEDSKIAFIYYRATCRGVETTFKVEEHGHKDQ